MIDTSLTFHLFSNCCSIWHFQLNVHWFFVRINFSTGDIFHQIQQEACCSNFEVFFTLFMAQFSQQKKSLPKQWVSLLQGLLLDTPEDYEKFLEKESHPCLTDLQYKDDDERVGVILLASFGLIFICFDMEFQSLLNFKVSKRNFLTFM